MAEHDDIFSELGFEADEAKASEVQAACDKAGTSDNGAHKIEGAWSKGDVSVHLERNTAPEDSGDEMTTVVTHPPVFVISKGGKPVASAMQRDSEALKVVLSQLAG